MWLGISELGLCSIHWFFFFSGHWRIWWVHTGWQIVESVWCVVAVAFRDCMVRQAVPRADRDPCHLEKVAVCQECGHSVHRAQGSGGAWEEQPGGMWGPLNPPRKPGCCLLSLEPVREVQAIWNWVVCYTGIDTRRILIHNTCSLYFAKLFLNHFEFLSSQKPCKAGWANILRLLCKWDNLGPEMLSELAKVTQQVSVRTTD